MRTTILVARVAFLGAPTRDGRILHRPIVADTLPVYNALPKGRELVGSARVDRSYGQRVERSSELVARLEIAPYVAGPLLQYRRFVHIEGTDGAVERDGDGGPIVITGMHVRALYCSDAPWGWAQPWVAHVEEINA